MDFVGHSSNIDISLPYSVGHFQGDVSGVEKRIYRSGLAPLQARLSVNLIGAPAMSASEFRRWKQKTLIGASLTMTAPTGQYDPNKILSLGAARWSFKPEAALSQIIGSEQKWELDAYANAFSTRTTRPTTG